MKHVINKRQCKLCIGNTKIKHVWKFNYLGSVVADNRKCDIEIQRHIGIEKDVYQ